MKIRKQTAIKILVAMLTILMLTMCMQSTVFASKQAAYADGVGGSSSRGGNDYLDPDLIKPNDDANVANDFQSVAGSILGIVQIIAVAVAIIMLIVLAIKYISSAPNDKAEIKKHAVIYVVGAVLLFGASGILQLIKNFSGVFDK